MKTKYLSYQQVHLAANPNPRNYPVLLIWKYWFDRIGQAFNRLLASGSEPKVSEKKNRNGTVYWHVYDPVLDYTASFGSELEVRLWLDQYFARSPDRM